MLLRNEDNYSMRYGVCQVFFLLFTIFLGFAFFVDTAPTVYYNYVGKVFNMIFVDSRQMCRGFVRLKISREKGLVV